MREEAFRSHTKRKILRPLHGRDENDYTAEICKVIGGGRGANGEVGKPLSPKTLYRYF